MRESLVTDEAIEVDGLVYRRLEGSSSATYFSRWGAHFIEEPLYRAAGVHNGPTIKPVEVRLGIVEHMTPDLARVVGALSADHPSRELERTLLTTRHASPSRAFLLNHLGRMGGEVAELAEDLETAARKAVVLPAKIASVSCGLDRMSVRMGEAVDGALCSRAEPYERSPPPLREYHYRKAWVGSTSVYDADGNELQTWRYGVEATAAPEQLAKRAVADVELVLARFPEVPVHCVQDAAPELRALPRALTRELAAGTPIIELVDFEHLMGYLDKVIDACEPGDPHDRKGAYRSDLLDDDDAIDRIQDSLRKRAG